MTVKKRLLSILMVLIMTAVALVPSAYIILNASHDCEGEHCVICENIALCEKTVSKLLNDLILFVTAVTVIITSVQLIFSAQSTVINLNPVFLKQKLLN